MTDVRVMAGTDRRRDRWRRWLAETAGFARAMADRSEQRRLERIYLLSDTHNWLGEQTRYLNMGYWRNPAGTLDEASAELARLVGQHAELGPGLRVVSVGAGYGEENLLWRQEFGVTDGVGVEISSHQRHAATERAAELGLGEDVTFTAGTAAELPLPDASCDRVISLESALHFPSRREFFVEAARVLAPGGRIVLADIILKESVYRRLRRLPLRHRVFPDGLFAPGTLAEALRQDGFEDVTVTVITEGVFEPFARYVARRRRSTEYRRIHPALRLVYSPPAARTLGRYCDYVIAVAERREDAGDSAR